MTEAKKPKKKSLLCKVALLDDSEIEVTLDKKAKGRDLLESVGKYLRLNTLDNFGLIHTATKLQKLWVQEGKKLRKQFKIKDMEWSFAFRVRYYPQDPTTLTEDIVKYQICLQVRLDLNTGVLTCPPDILAEMTSYWLQSEFGDTANDAQEVREYLSSLQPSENPKAMPDFEKRVLELYKTRKGIVPSAADAKFLSLASNLPMYGVHFFKGKDKADKEISIGIGAAGIYEKRQTVETMTHTWRRVKNIEYSNSKFYLKLLRAPNNGDPRLKKVFVFPSEEQTRLMWQCGVDHHVFFRIDGIGAEAEPKPKKAVKRKRSSLRRLFSKKSSDGVVMREEPKLLRGASFRRSASFRDTSASTTPTASPMAETKPEVLLTVAESDATEEKQAKAGDSNTGKKKDLGEKEKNYKQEIEEMNATERKDETSTLVTAVVENTEAESDGEEFKDDDFVDDVMDATMKDSSTLLLTETIVEEDEESHPSISNKDEYKSPEEEKKECAENRTVSEKELGVPPVLETNFNEEDYKQTKKYDTRQTIETDKEFLREMIKEDKTPNHVTDKIFERDVIKDDYNNFTKIAIEASEFGNPVDVMEITTAEEVYTEETIVSRPTQENNEDSEDDTLTPEDHDSPRKRSEVRFQDETEIFITSSEDYVLQEFTRHSDNRSSSSSGSEFSSKDVHFIPEEVFDDRPISPPRYEDVDTDEADVVIQDNSYKEFSIEVPQFIPRKNSEEQKRNKKADFKVSTWKQSSFHETYEGEDENKTEGLSTTGAELGDDDFLMDEFEDETRIVVEDNLEFQDNYKVDTTINLEEMEESLSDITDDTDELCSPKIVEETWLRTLGPENEIFMELFKKKPDNVKLRRDKNKKRNTVRSQIIDVDEQDEVMEGDADTPRLSDIYSLPKRTTLRKEPLVEREGSSRRRFIPSWPFDPQAYVSKMDDELDKEAIKAAIEAQKELVEENKRIEEMDFWMNVTDDTPDSCLSVDPLETAGELQDAPRVDLLSKHEAGEPTIHKNNLITNVPKHPYVSKLNLGSRSPSTSPRNIGEKFIPGVPDFVHSVIYNYLHSSSSSNSTPFDEVESPQKKSEVENLKYPSPILTFSPRESESVGERSRLSYEPTIPNPKTDVTDEVFKDTKSDEDNQPQNPSSSATESNDEMLSKSTSSSTSSFPSFVHSVYPLRKLSTTITGRKRGRSKQRRERKQKKKIGKIKANGDKAPTNIANVNHKESHTDTPRPPEQEIDKIILSDNDESHFARHELPDTAREVRPSPNFC